MFENETKIIIHTILQRIPQSAMDKIAIKDILAADIPYSIKTFFRADVEAMLLEELQRHRKTSRFNFDHHEVQSLQKQINSILVLNFAFKNEEFQLRLNDAVHMIINYLIRPQWTLISVIFEKDQTIFPQGLFGLLRYFGPYEYLRDIITQYIKEKQVASFSKEEFKSLVWKIDGEYIRRKSGDELVKVMSPIYDFFDFPNKTDSNSLQIKALIKFFEDKGLIAVLPRLEGEIVQEKTELNRKELSILLEDTRRTAGAFLVEKVEIEQQEFIHKSSDANFPSTTTENKNQQDRTPIFDFESLLSESDKKRFIKKIFNENEDAFSSTLQSLSKMNSWKFASKFIDETFIKHDVDPYSSEAKRFIEVMFEQYHPKK